MAKRKKTTPSEPPKPSYYVQYYETSYMIDEPEDSNEPYSYQGSYGGNVSIYGIHRTNPTGFDYQKVREYEACYGIEDVPTFEYAYVLVCEYTTGDTFGNHDTWCIAGVFVNEADADEACLKCYQPPKQGDYRNYRSWDGYFEHLKKARVEKLLVQP